MGPDNCISRGRQNNFGFLRARHYNEGHLPSLMSLCMKPWLLFFPACLLSVTSWSAPLPASDVFQARVQQVDPNTFAVHWQIKPGYFLYRDRITLSAEKNSGVRLGDLRFPEPLKKTDRLGQTY